MYEFKAVHILGIFNPHTSLVRKTFAKVSSLDIFHGMNDNIGKMPLSIQPKSHGCKHVTHDVKPALWRTVLTKSPLPTVQIRRRTFGSSGGDPGCQGWGSGQRAAAYAAFRKGRAFDPAKNEVQSGCTNLEDVEFCAHYTDAIHIIWSESHA